MTILLPVSLSGIYLRTPTAAFVLSVLLVAAYLTYRWALPKPIPGIPYNRAATRNVFGDLPELLACAKRNESPRKWLLGQNSRLQSPLVQVWLAPFGKPILVMSDFQAARDVLLRRNKEFDHGRKHVDVFSSTIPNHHIAMKTTDSRFKGNKELIRDLMSPTFLNDVSAGHIHAKTMNLIRLWSLKVDAIGSQPFVAAADIFDAAVDMINAAAFGLDDSMSATANQYRFLAAIPDIKRSVKQGPKGAVEFPRAPQLPFIATFEKVNAYTSSQFRAILPRLQHRWNLATKPQIRQDMAEKDAIIVAEIKKSLCRIEAGESSQRAAVDHIVTREQTVAPKEGREPDYFSGRIIDELFGYFIAGHETTASAITWAIKLLADYQNVQEQLRAELRAAYGGANGSRQPSHTEILKTSIPYIEAVMEEILRFKNPVPIVSRDAQIDTTLLGYRVPKGTSMFILSGGPSYISPSIPLNPSLRAQDTATRDKSAVPEWNADDISEFKPERWLKSDENGNVEFDHLAGPFLSFSLGPRGCFGKRLAYMEFRIMLVLLIWNFRFRKLDAELSTYNVTDGITSRPNTCCVGLEKVEY